MTIWYCASLDTETVQEYIVDDALDMPLREQIRPEHRAYTGVVYASAREAERLLQATDDARAVIALAEGGPR